jgi:hypothetical protein
MGRREDRSSDDIIEMPCLGEYLESNYACKSACQQKYNCILYNITLDELPEYLVSDDFRLQEEAKKRLDELRSNDC